MSLPARPRPPLGHALLTPAYDAAVQVLVPERALSRALLRFVPEQAGSGLDFGCGTGLFLQQANGRKGTVWTGLEPATPLRRQARARVPAGVGLTAYTPGRPLPYPDAHFGVLTARWVLEHFSPEELDFYLPELWRVLRPGGRLLLADWGPPRGRLQRLLTALTARLDPLQNRIGPAGGWPDLLQSAGFQQVACVFRQPTLLGTFTIWVAEKPLAGVFFSKKIKARGV